MPITQFSRVSITVAELTTTAAFYRDALGLTVGPERPIRDPAWFTLLGLPDGVTARAVDVAVGRQTIQLVAFDPPGKPYPAERASNDQWFQHLALVCGDIGGVDVRLEIDHPGAITIGVPVLLPPNTGNVTAFKFRDPEGHPLELIYFPEGVGAPVWHETAGTGILGYDHSAIAVADLDRSIAFYTTLLGFNVAGRSLNRGPEQDRLDGLAGCKVDVVALAPSIVAAPHIELLDYRTPRGRPLTGVFAADDVPSARQVHTVDDLDALAARLAGAGVRFVSPGVVTLHDGTRAAAVRDPDGHMLVLTE